MSRTLTHPSARSTRTLRNRRCRRRLLGVVDSRCPLLSPSRQVPEQGKCPARNNRSQGAQWRKKRQNMNGAAWPLRPSSAPAEPPRPLLFRSPLPADPLVPRFCQGGPRRTPMPPAALRRLRARTEARHARPRVCHWPALPLPCRPVLPGPVPCRPGLKEEGLGGGQRGGGGGERGGGGEQRGEEGASFFC